eukprot:TRINITY_DN640_c1_g1_i1.p1 TRINITY_DN640_c1_g1~~TRINITY_DN640_c1_g1_i1.p1  ORF type:complete len:266 (+),score=137.34 TRINITY_DN640_c1_g1_i1:105-902(+)
MGARTTLALSLAVLGCLVTDASAMFGGKGSAVKELNSRTLPGFLNTHKPVMLLLYAPWCGHCKAIHPDFEKLAKSLDGIVRVGAVDADQHKEIGQQYGVRGFPTIKMFGMTPDKKGRKKPIDYQQERSFAAMKKTAQSLIQKTGVLPMKKLASLPEGESHVILFTKKSAVPDLYAVASLSPKLKAKFKFFIAKEKADAKLAEAYEIPSWPSIAVVEKKEGEETPSTRWLEFTKGMKYNDVAEFINGGPDKKESAEGGAKKKKKSD